MSTTSVDLAVRAWALPADHKPPTGLIRATGQAWFPNHILFVDTETTTDHTQRLLFGAWRYCRLVVNPDGALEVVCVAEGLFYDDELPERDPEGFAALRVHAERERADVDPREPDARPRLQLESLSSWLNGVFWRVAYKLRAAVVCFNAPFDLSRLAWHVGEARRSRRRTRDEDGTVRPAADSTRDAFRGGFSFVLWSYLNDDGERVEGRHRPRMAVKSIDSKRSLKGFRSPDIVDPEDQLPDPGTSKKQSWFPGHFLDLRTLVFALTDRGHTLESACEAFGVPYTKRQVEHGRITDEYIAYCREDVGATQALAEAALTEFRRHPIDLQATRAYSPATIGRAYLKRMGITPPRSRQTFGNEVHGWAMSAYYGGRAECRIRRTQVPVVYCDFRSMYPTVCALMNLSGLLTAEQLHAVDATKEVQELLDRVTADDCFDPELWPQLVGIAQVIPAGDVLPVRARYGPGPSFQIGVNHLTSSEPMWFTIADLIASKLLTGKTPQITRAIRFTGTGTLPGLTPVRLLGETPVDPASEDFFRTVIEQRTLAKDQGDARRDKGLKTLANATSYGIYAQMTRREPTKERHPVLVHGRPDEPFERKIAAPEDPGEFAFPPFAAVITGAARLMLAIVEDQVAQAGGHYAFCDTDSMAIVATRNGRLVPCEGGPEQTSNGKPAIRALSWKQVEAIRERFTQLNPYDPAIAGGSLLQMENENYLPGTKGRRQLHCYAISAKRYTFLTDARR